MRPGRGPRFADDCKRSKGAEHPADKTERAPVIAEAQPADACGERS
jgi:hypothetical protein